MPLMPLPIPTFYALMLWSLIGLLSQCFNSFLCCLVVGGSAPIFDTIQLILCWILTLCDVDAIHFCEKKVQSNTQVCLFNTDECSYSLVYKTQACFSKFFL